MKYAFWSAIVLFIIGLIIDFRGLGYYFIIEAGFLFVVAGIINIYKELTSFNEMKKKYIDNDFGFIEGDIKK